ncbi:MAG: Crp/Fnr family transcriptional regulator [Alphaproteobacteria bacterium]
MSDIASLLRAMEIGASRRALEAGEMLFAAGDRAERLFVVERGRLLLRRHAADGAVLTLHVARAGNTLAEASLFSPAYHCDAIAEIPSRVLAYSNPDLLRAIRGDEAVAARFLSAFAGQVQTLRGQVQLMTIRSARDRVLAYIRGRVPTGRRWTEIDGSWKAAAAEIGLSHEAVYRALAGLEHDGIVRRRGRVVTLTC